jgi:hypothetical protein
MCLCQVTDNTLYPDEFGTGYSTRVPDEDGTIVRSTYFLTPYTLGRWYYDNKNMTLNWGDQEYTTGFHIFPDLDDAVLWCKGEREEAKVVRVKWKERRAKGIQIGTYAEGIALVVGSIYHEEILK